MAVEKKFVPKEQKGVAKSVSLWTMGVELSLRHFGRSYSRRRNFPGEKPL